MYPVPFEGTLSSPSDYPPFSQPSDCPIVSRASHANLATTSIEPRIPPFDFNSQLTTPHFRGLQNPGETKEQQQEPLGLPHCLYTQNLHQNTISERVHIHHRIRINDKSWTRSQQFQYFLSNTTTRVRRRADGSRHRRPFTRMICIWNGLSLGVCSRATPRCGVSTFVEDPTTHLDWSWCE